MPSECLYHCRESNKIKKKERENTSKLMNPFYLNIKRQIINVDKSYNMFYCIISMITMEFLIKQLLISNKITDMIAQKWRVLTSANWVILLV